MKEAIQKAIEGGYLQGKNPLVDITTSENGDKVACVYFDGPGRPTLGYGKAINDILLDPPFWQALGKAEGWDNWNYGWFVKVWHGGAWEWRQSGDEDVFWGGSPSEMPNIVTWKEGWEYHWHRFIDHLAEGKDVDLFFKELLK